MATLFKLETPAKATKGTINEKGTGLGLLLCRDFVERHGGKIQVETELGRAVGFILPYRWLYLNSLPIDNCSWKARFAKHVYP
ncbi:ATP-binding protein [Pontibacter sp. BAB1700]|uniref:ATP-binding protein n=1 Tax=Pontibacter sp. BAB1700 TaxID=1144253 RepID=UPI00026BDA7D|nr:ATP-binding protein [Pontibacter sp. BAB1700]EJF08421.1 ATPase [Pontibacter sp. BAB1700]